MDPFIEAAKAELKSPDAKVRQLAVKNLVGQKSYLIISLLISAAKDEDPYVRMYAATVLGTTDDASSVPTLLRLLRDDDAQVRMSAAKALRGCQHEMAIAQLIRSLKDSSPKVREAAIQSLVVFPYPHVVTAIIDVLSDKVEEVREAAAEALLSCANKVDPILLIPTLKDSAPGVRHNIALCMGATKQSSARIPLENHLRLEKESYVQEGILLGLGSLGDPLAIPAIQPFLDTDHDNEIRRAAAKAFSLVADVKSVDLLLNYIEDDDEEFQQTMVNALNRIKNPSILPLLEQFLSRNRVRPDIVKQIAAVIQDLTNQKTLLSSEQHLIPEAKE